MQAVELNHRTMKTISNTTLSPWRYVSPRAELLEIDSHAGILAESEELESYVDDGTEIPW